MGGGGGERDGSREGRGEEERGREREKEWFAQTDKCRGLRAFGHCILKYHGIFYGNECVPQYYSFSDVLVIESYY